MSAALRQWNPGFVLAEHDRATLIADLDRTSRGQDDIQFPRGRKVTRILVTGFDPFTLDSDIRQANPSGALALAVDGVTLRGPGGPVRLEAAIFPVRWRDFGDGMVEAALLPHLISSAAQVDAFATTSQSRVGCIANVRDLYFINSRQDPYGCDDKQGRAMFERFGGTQIVRDDGHFGDIDQPYESFELLDRLID